MEKTLKYVCKQKEDRDCPSLIRVVDLSPASRPVRGSPEATTRRCPNDHLPAFVATLRTRQSLAAPALELCILTATRTSEILNAEWDEFDSRRPSGRYHQST